MKKTSKINMVLALILFCALFFYTANIYNNSNMEMGMTNQDTKVTIYTKPGCGYCIRAKSFLKSMNVDFNEIDVSTDRPRHMDLINKTGSRTVPYIFIKDKYIGGFTDMIQMAEDDQLNTILNDDSTSKT